VTFHHRDTDCDGQITVSELIAVVATGLD